MISKEQETYHEDYEEEDSDEMVPERPQKQIFESS